MTSLSRKGEPAAQLSESLHQQLNAYALAAGAAGVSFLAWPQPAEARIVYTAKHQVIGLSSRFSLDLNHDGKADVTFFETRHSTDEGGRITHLFASAAAGNALKGYRYFTSIGSGLPFASAVRKGQRIGGSQTRFGYGGRNTMAWANTSAGGGGTGGAWGNIVLQPYRYLGIRFQIKGKAHFGWARLIVTCSGVKITATMTGYAYETVPEKTVVAGQTTGSHDSAETQSISPLAPQPPSLGQLARGAVGLAAWRRREAVPTPQEGE
ncbi:MAG TPA: hypothetical protein VGP65_02995 [Candidatus Angelobacter sp.]|jgi:hypothetical protein|nr:hypothetical protein [Candidatus Angelobacter sp.]